MIDLQETRRLVVLLEKNPMYFEAIIEDTPMAIIITDKHGDITAVNKNFCLLFGYERCELVGENLRQVTPWENQSRLGSDMIQTREAKKKDGQLFSIWAETIVNQQIKDQAHKITMVLPVDEMELLKLKRNFYKRHMIF